MFANGGSISIDNITSNSPSGLVAPVMIVGTGVDIAEVSRIAASIERFGRRFVERIFTADEIRYCESKANKAERYAARFAAKEAAMKAIGTGWKHGVTWHDIWLHLLKNKVRTKEGREWSITRIVRACRAERLLQARERKAGLTAS